MTGLLAYILSKNFAKSYTDEQIALVSKGMDYKGSVSTFNNLPTSGNKKGDIYTTDDTGSEYIWTIDASSGSIDNWHELGGVDLSDYYTKSEIDSKFSNVDDDISDLETEISNVSSNLGEEINNRLAAEATMSSQISSKQPALSTEQLSAVNSGITSEKVTKLNGLVNPTIGYTEVV